MSTPKKRSYPVENVFNSAMCFQQTVQHLQAVSPITNPALASALGTPQIALSALTIELLFKALHVLDHADVPRTHDLVRLFEGLKPHTRAAIRKGWDDLEAASGARWHGIASDLGLNFEAGIEAALQHGRAAFEQYRYTFEDDDREAFYYLDGLRPILLRVILKRRPDLGERPIVPFPQFV